jgi:hypothetical protein
MTDRLCPGTGWTLGHVSVARQSAKGAERDRTVVPSPRRVRLGRSGRARSPDQTRLKRGVLTCPLISCCASPANLKIDLTGPSRFS